MKIILTHSNADFDAVSASLAAHKLYPDATPVLPERLNRNVRDFMTLYRNGLSFVNEHDLKTSGIRHVILVDTQRSPGLPGLKANTPLTIIDHHQPYKNLPNYTSEPVGATTTLLVERIQQEKIPITTLEATLMALGIYEDTGSLAYSTTTPRDIRAAAWLLEQNAALDTVRRFLSPPLTDEQQALFETLMHSADSRLVHGYTITVARAEIDHHVEHIASVAHRLRDMLDPSALFVAVQMPENLLLVCRSAEEALDVGEIARAFGGGGHPRAAAATIYDKPLSTVVEILWEHIWSNVRPMTRVEDLMSYGVQTVPPDEQISAVVQQLRRIGHEGFPVVEDGRVIGLLTRREVDRAVEHGLGHLTIREIMTSGQLALHPADSVLTLEQAMVESGWGQIPVMDDQQRLIGIVTRTDLIKHWARTHPATMPGENIFSLNQVAGILGEPVASLIERIAHQAQSADLSLYLVGGVVRDLLLKRHNLDLDFVVESSAIDFAHNLRDRFGGEVHSHQPFGTAKWLLDESAAEALSISLDNLPPHLDFATARNEFYEHPTALPTVYRSGIKLDLQRRDFTINTLAIQLSPESALGRILDYYGGQVDLEKGVIRVLHSLSFVDDPTRILRAIRFERRLGFRIEPRTAELITGALPMLRRITGERVRNEINLLLQEDQPAQALLDLQVRGLLNAIHPHFTITEDIHLYFQRLRQQPIDWPSADSPTDEELCWHALACAIPLAHLPEICERLRVGRRLRDSLLAAARLVQGDILTHPDLRPSQIVTQLDEMPHTAMLAAWLLTGSDLIRSRIDTYLRTWRHIHPETNGHTLREMGIRPGPCYRVILHNLKTAHLDGEISQPQDEQQIIEQLLREEESCRDES